MLASLTIVLIPVVDHRLPLPTHKMNILLEIQRFYYKYSQTNHVQLRASTAQLRASQPQCQTYRRAGRTEAALATWERRSLHQYPITHTGSQEAVILCQPPASDASNI
jgi:hypothetical protein